MPNWIQGTMKIRGKTNNVLDFIINEIQIDESTYMYGEKVLIARWLSSIKGSKSAFVDSNRSVSLSFDLKKTIQEIAIPIKQAWSFSPSEGDEIIWVNLSKKYSIDIRLQGFECGMEFYQDLAVCNGKLTVNEIKKYENWFWDCPFPMLGG